MPLNRNQIRLDNIKGRGYPAYLGGAFPPCTRNLEAHPRPLAVGELERLPVGGVTPSNAVVRF